MSSADEMSVSSSDPSFDPEEDSSGEDLEQAVVDWESSCGQVMFKMLKALRKEIGKHKLRLKPSRKDQFEEELYELLLDFLA